MLYFSSKLRDFESTGLVLYPQNAGETDFTANGQIKFDLPSNTLVDLDSLHIDAKCFCDDGTANAVNRLPADIHKLIRRVEVTAGGQELGHAYNFYDRLKHGVDALTGKEPGPTSHPRLLRTGLDSAEGPTAFTAKALAKKAAIAAVEAAVPTLYSSTIEHLPLKAPLDGGAAGITPADGTVNIIGRHSATKLSVCGYSADGYTKVMTETTFTWLQLAAALDVDGAQLVPLFEVLGFANYSTTQAMVDAIAAAQQAVLDTRSSRTFENEGEAETNDVRFTFDSFGGFLQTVQPRMLDLSILPTISITLHLNTPECLVAAAGDEDPDEFLKELSADEVASGFTVRDPRLYITAIGFSNSSYDSYVSAALSKRAIELPFRNYTHFHDAQFTDSIGFQTSSRSVDKIHFQLSNQSDRDNLKEQAQVVVSKGWREMYVPLENSVFLEPITIAYSGAGMVDSRCTGEKYAARRYLCSHTGQSRPDVATDPNATFQLSINGMLRPTFPADATWWYKESALALSEERDPWNGGALFAEWTQDVSHKVLRLNRRGSTVQTASGIDTRNSMLYCQLNCPSTLGASAVPARMDVWIESTSLLRVVAARDIELVA